MRKVLCFCSVLLILVLSAAPALAAVDFDSMPHYSVLKFDYVSGSLAPGVLAPWPFNSAMPGCTDSFSLAERAFEGKFTSVVHSGHRLNGSFNTPTVATDIDAQEHAVLTLFRESDQIIVRGYLEDGYLIFSDPYEMSILSARLSGTVYSVVTEKLPASENQVYQLRQETFDVTFSVENSVAQLGDYLAEILNSMPKFNGQYYVVVNDFKVELEVVRHTVSTPSFVVSSSITSNIYDLNQWFDPLFIPISTTEVSVAPDQDMFSWLLVSIDSFLSLEIVPGFSLNGMFTIILVIGILLWFIKLIK